MCVLVCLLRPNHPLPLIAAHLRDEHKFRQSTPPAKHWPRRKHLVGGLDRRRHGSWLVFDQTKQTLWSIINLPGTLGSQPGGLSRGQALLNLAQYDHRGRANHATSGFCEKLPRDAIIFRLNNHRVQAWAYTQKLIRQEIKEGFHIFGPQGWWNKPSARLQSIAEALKPHRPETIGDHSWHQWHDTLFNHGSTSFRLDGPRVVTLSVSLLALRSQGSRFKPLDKLLHWCYWQRDQGKTVKIIH